MKKTILLFINMILGASLYANTCETEIESFSVNWTAYKTSTRVGVSGTFENPNLETRRTKDICFLSFLPTTTVHIDTATIKTDNAKRDATIIVALFKNMVEGAFIDAIIKRVDLESKELSVEITMNDVTQTIYMPYTFKGKVFSAKGKIDLLNFSAEDALSSLDEACEEKHKGKTWSDVEVSFVIIIKNECKI